jgi:hypothetical protein
VYISENIPLALGEDGQPLALRGGGACKQREGGESQIGREEG